MTRPRYASDSKPRDRKTAVCECGAAKRPESVSCRSCAHQRLSGDANPMWRGGSRLDSYGYRLVLRALDHPKAHNGYVREHVLVMEKRLRRLLQSGETVHHLNGVRDDNRDENLELWTQPQPKGVRATDAVRHAVAVLEQYAPELLA